MTDCNNEAKNLAISYYEQIQKIMQAYNEGGDFDELIKDFADSGSAYGISYSCESPTQFADSDACTVEADSVTYILAGGGPSVYVICDFYKGTVTNGRIFYSWASTPQQLHQVKATTEDYNSDDYASSELIGDFFANLHGF